MKILLSGFGRSGTSFCGGIFQQNLEMAYLYEPFWGDTFVKNHQMYWLNERDSEPEGEKLLSEVFNGRFDEVDRVEKNLINPQSGFATRREELTAQMRGKDIGNGAHIAIKEIRLNMHLRWVLKVIGGELRVIHLVRDPRGVVASFLLESEAVPSQHYGRLNPLKYFARRPKTKQSIYAEWQWNKLPSLRRFASEFEFYTDFLQLGSAHQCLAARWAVSMAHAIRDSEKIPANQYFRLRYEDLCKDPIGTAAAVYRFLDLRLPAPVEDWLAKNTQGGNRQERYGTSRNSLEMIDVWRSQLNRNQIRDIESVCGPLMETLGYL